MPKGDKPKAERKTGPREYVVFREYTVGELVTLANDREAREAAKLDEGAVVLVPLGEATGATPKAARIEAAKRYLDADELAAASKGKDAKGIPLNAVAKAAATNGRKPIKIHTEPKFEA